MGGIPFAAMAEQARLEHLQRLKERRHHRLIIAAAPVFALYMEGVHDVPGRTVAQAATMAVNDAEALLAEIERRES